ncbi:MAG: histidinol dehydrogenase [Kiritimatiellia bacterium]
MQNTIPIVDWSLTQREESVERFLQRPTFDVSAEAAATKCLTEIRTQGVEAVLNACRLFDGATLTRETMRISDAELLAAEAACDETVKRAIHLAHDRVARFAKAGMRPDWTIPTAHGGRLGERFHAMDRVGVYIPGGTAPLASTSIMTVTLAKVAGVKEIVACTPSRGGLAVSAPLLYALKVAGATEIYRVGGIQSIGMMAYGAGMAPVDLIAGPGNAYVTAAKRQVYGTVAIDQVAGPSEICVLADRAGKAPWIAADLLSQAEHGSGLEKSFLVTDSRAFAEEVRTAVFAQLESRDRRVIIERMLTNGGMCFAVVPNLQEDGVALCNRFAAEHLELQVADAEAILPRITCAGAVFVGYWTPESAGDFVAGPSHVLPTGGAARMFSGLTAETFRRRSSFVEFSKEDLAETREAIETFGRLEGLDAHAYAATVRFE